MSIPRFTLISGSRCSNCHYNPQGSGIRNELGWSAMSEAGALTLEGAGLQGLQSESNTYFGGKLAVGFDVRAQLVKLGRPPFDKRRFFPMQVATHAALTPFEGLNIYGGYNFATLKYSYPGQTSWNGAIQYQPTPLAPSIRAGLIQPSIGLRHDDHTMFVRRDAAHATAPQPIIPPDYNEYGAELTYEGQSWLTVNVGAYDSKNMSMVEPTVQEGGLLWSTRLALWPQLLDDGINGALGGSILGAGDYSIYNVFAGIGLSDKAMILGEGTYTENVDQKKRRNYSVQASLQLKEWLALETRYEWGQAEIPPSDLHHASAFTVGAQFFPIPYLELRPEYRYFENDDYRQGQYTLQIHAFY